MPEYNPHRALRLNHLGTRLSTQYDRTGNLQDLEAAIEHANTTVEATPEDHPIRAASRVQRQQWRQHYEITIFKEGKEHCVIRIIYKTTLQFSFVIQVNQMLYITSQFTPPARLVKSMTPDTPKY
ncbi:hypothetical protein EV426DRAFT_645861 [Tirmania nivea]|nr:hypothetical protein EV426DRAFT_645861 [Tirmania nivea]